MINLTATTVLVVGLILIVVIGSALIAYQTAHRLDRLHVRTDLSWQSLEAALARRAAVARAVAVSLPAGDGARLRRMAGRAEHADRDVRELRENQLSGALNGLDPEALPRSLVAELADSDTRVMMARRFHNDAVRDTRTLRGRRFVRMLHLGGTAPMPQYFDIVDRAGLLPASLLAETERRRIAARAVLLDPDGEVLLIRGHDPTADPADPVRFWFTVGGAVEPGEDLLAAVAREVYEETGRRVPVADFIGPVFRREAVFAFDGDLIDSEEYFFVAAVPQYEPVPAALNADERRYIDELRWCSIEDIRAFAGFVYPKDLATVLPRAREVLALGRPPAIPLDID